MPTPSPKSHAANSASPASTPPTSDQDHSRESRWAFGREPSETSESPARATLREPDSATPPVDSLATVANRIEPRTYDSIFWLAYLANGLVTLANALMVRYSDFVTAVGGEERQLGFVVGCGMVGSIAIRAIQGEAIDRYGAGRIWIGSILVYALSLALHLTITSAYSPSIFAARLVMQASLAGVFGSSITFVSLRVPAARMAEVIGTLGTSGFIGIMVGPLIGDALGIGADRQLIVRLFGVAGGFAVFSAIATWLACRDEVPPQKRRRPRLARVIRKYLPLMVSLTAVAMGAGFSIPMTFLKKFAEEIRVERVGVFFLVYAIVAFLTRLGSRRVFERFGNRPWILVGLGLLAVSFLCYIPTTRAWHLAFPAVLAGAAHALLFPSVVASCTSAFPRRYLGVATSVTLAMFDIGTLVGAPVVGSFLRAAKSADLPAYPLMFAGTAVAIGAIGLSYWLSTRRVPA